MFQEQDLSFSDAQGVLLRSVEDAVTRVRHLHGPDGKTVPPAPLWERYGAAITIRPKDFLMEKSAASFADVLVPIPRLWWERLLEGGISGGLLLCVALIGLSAARGEISSNVFQVWWTVLVCLLFSPSLFVIFDTGLAEWKKRGLHLMLWFVLRESVPCRLICFCFEMIAYRQWVRSGRNWLASRNEESELRALYEGAALAYAIRLKEQKMRHEHIYRTYQERVLASMKLAGVFVNIPSEVLEGARDWLHEVYEVCLPEEFARAERKLTEIDDLILHMLIVRTAHSAEQRSRLPALEAELRARVGELNDIMGSLDTNCDNALPMKLPNLPPKPEVVRLVSLP
ncbi:hypothetical protein KBB27_03570 [Patescibacteria group bacterium]|nr:hypothetical protein [Patescibacteria group bacterium]